MKEHLEAALQRVGPRDVRIATAYLTPDGFLSLKAGLSRAETVRLVLGERPFLNRRGPRDILTQPGEEDELQGPAESVDWYTFLEGGYPWLLLTHEERAQLLERGEDRSREAFDLSAWERVHALASFLRREGVHVRRFLGCDVGDPEDWDPRALSAMIELHDAPADPDMPAHLHADVEDDRDKLGSLLTRLEALAAAWGAGGDPKVKAVRELLESLPWTDEHEVPTKVAILTNYRDGRVPLQAVGRRFRRAEERHSGAHQPQRPALNVHPFRQRQPAQAGGDPRALRSAGGAPRRRSRGRPGAE